MSHSPTRTVGFSEARAGSGAGAGKAGSGPGAPAPAPRRAPPPRQRSLLSLSLSSSQPIGGSGSGAGSSLMAAGSCSALSSDGCGTAALLSPASSCHASTGSWPAAASDDDGAGPGAAGCDGLRTTRAPRSPSPTPARRAPSWMPPRPPAPRLTTSWSCWPRSRPTCQTSSARSTTQQRPCWTRHRAANRGPAPPRRAARWRPAPQRDCRMRTPPHPNFAQKTNSKGRRRGRARPLLPLAIVSLRLCASTARRGGTAVCPAARRRAAIREGGWVIPLAALGSTFQ
ncbi:hypothetical protein Rsub_01770 [Raphidocelis subcapitata]|uniref:Uncharacterized protein n=1 Tax=Raphidocelis subcapitata TaxID=307507 RepID=A0A2V0NU28_9CHLO|nr:hypothetical protein Rsub_01770 [Raphidocelis subcapitata]|eukprot:GBF89053.1 hypothetical protein Rsub_01770 [Raphidocelis subcapitata]